ncbi:MAG: hypothetical protein DRI79_13875 [Chloroflexi bacterium]|nr:MAG: hypothetical protein DRI79_13875 [Chloroflexota bacterium]
MAEVTLQDAVKKFASDLAEKVNTFVADISELEVRTYTTPADQVGTFITGEAGLTEILTEGKATLRAYTKIAFDGDMTVLVPTGPSGEIEESVWALHQMMVQQAMEHRAAMIQAVGEAAASALKALGMAGGE